MSTDATGATAQPGTANEGTPAIGEAKPNAPLPIAEKQPEPKADAGPAAIVYEPTNDPALDMALEFVGKFGIGPDDPAMVAAGDGNFALLEAKLAAMGDKAKGYEKFVALGKSSYASVKEKSEAAAAKQAEVIHNAVGGADQWKAIKEWAGTNAEPEEKKVVNAALQAGGIQAKAMALYLAQLYDKASGVNQPGRPAVKKDAGGGDTPGAGALTPRAYTQEVEALRKKLGGRFEGSAEYRQLQARRQAWRS